MRQQQGCEKSTFFFLGFQEKVRSGKYPFTEIQEKYEKHHPPIVYFCENMETPPDFFSARFARRFCFNIQYILVDSLYKILKLPPGFSRRAPRADSRKKYPKLPRHPRCGRLEKVWKSTKCFVDILGDGTAGRDHPSPIPPTPQTRVDGGVRASQRRNCVD